jgi:hypothetical protein
MPVPDRCRLLFGPYRPPRLRPRDRATCLARDCDVVVTGLSAGRIAWPRCRALGTHGGGSGILVDEELARAVRTESAAAVGYWWGVSVSTVAWWRRALGVTRTNNDGSRRLVVAAAEAGGAAMRKRGLTDEEADERSERARRLNLGRHLIRGGGYPLWTAAAIQLLGTAPDADVAKQLGKTVEAVRLKRTRLRIPTAIDGRRRENRQGAERAKRRGYGSGEFRGPHESGRVRG